MVRKVALTKKYNQKYKRKHQTPQLPANVTKALAEKGIEIPKPKSAKEFYAQLGLKSNPNSDVRGIIGFNDDLGKALQKTKRAPKEIEVENKIPFVDIVESMPKGQVYQKKLSEYEFKILSQLRLRYGDDYDMMAIDHRRNPLQWTPTQIKRLNKIYEQEAEAITQTVEEKIDE